MDSFITEFLASQKETKGHQLLTFDRWELNCLSTCLRGLDEWAELNTSAVRLPGITRTSLFLHLA